MKVIEPTGADTLIHTEFNSTEIICRVNPESVDKSTKSMTLTVDTSKILFFDKETELRIR